MICRLSLELEDHNVNKHVGTAIGVGNDFREMDRRRGFLDDETRATLSRNQASTSDNRTNLELWLTISVLMSALDRLELV